MYVQKVLKVHKYKLVEASKYKCNPIKPFRTLKAPPTYLFTSAICLMKKIELLIPLKGVSNGNGPFGPSASFQIIRTLNLVYVQSYKTIVFLLEKAKKEFILLLWLDFYHLVFLLGKVFYFPDLV